MSRATFRFAPSPNGLLHLGHAYSAILNHELARRAGGRFLLRIEDIDRERCRPAFEAAIYEDLAWLGLAWETPVRRQSEHFGTYREALDRLTATGLTYRSFMSRAEATAAVAEIENGGADWPRDPDGAPLYPGRERDLPAAEVAARIEAGAPFVVRLRMDEAIRRAGPLAWREQDAAGRITEIAADPAAWGDVVLARRDTPTSYHLSVVVDDALQGVTEIVRGRDLQAATSVHRLLQTLLAIPSPAYRHHPLVTDATGRKLSKSASDTGLAALRAAGVSAAEVRRATGVDRELG